MDYRNKKILFAVLNWGLGHATRSTVLIERLLTQNNEVTIASDGLALQYLQNRFPQLSFAKLPAYEVSYGKSRVIALIKNGLSTQKAVLAEKKWLKNHLKENCYDYIISDNRYGIYSKGTPSYIITHQINIKVPFGKKIVNWQNHHWLNKFDEVWIPDVNNELSGELSYPIPAILKSKVREIGWLSRFKKLNETSVNTNLVVAIVSGPEPERTILQDKLTSILSKLAFDSILYEGKPGESSHRKVGNCTIKNHASDQEMEDDIQQANVIVSRSGYSSLMDYKVLNKSAILIPTPGQPEQEYLAEYLSKQFKVVAFVDLNELLFN